MCLGIGSAVSNATISYQLQWFGSGGVLLLGAISTWFFTMGASCMVTGWMVYVCIGMLLPFGFSWSTAAAGVIASELPKSQQGHLQGAIDSMLNIAQVRPTRERERGKSRQFSGGSLALCRVGARPLYG
jgi:hypothetical protein